MKKLLEKVDYSIQENKGKMNELFSDVMEDLKEADEESYKEAKCELYEIVYGKKLSEEMAEKWVKEMKPIGKHWTMEDTTSAAQSMGYNVDKTDYFIVANMMYNDYYDLVKDDESMALKLAYDWLNDKDAKEHKLYDYWKYIAERD